MFMRLCIFNISDSPKYLDSGFWVQAQPHHILTFQPHPLPSQGRNFQIIHLSARRLTEAAMASAAAGKGKSPADAADSSAARAARLAREWSTCVNCHSEPTS
jgi:hypothetical protein